VSFTFTQNEDLEAVLLAIRDWEILIAEEKPDSNWGAGILRND
jgi:predicted NAD-dependent protein-ADP-ribosyltransferase YbiA (DUF1768 family)